MIRHPLGSVQVFPDRQGGHINNEHMRHESPPPSYEEAVSGSNTEQAPPPYYRTEAHGSYKLHKETEDLVKAHDKLASDDAIRTDFSSVFDKNVTISGAYNYNPKAVIEEAYTQSATCRRLTNHAFSREDNPKISITSEGVFSPSANLAEKTVRLPGDKSWVKNHAYLSTQGMRDMSLERGVIHEVVHALTGLGDPDPDYADDCPGPVSHYTNLILKEMGRNEPFRVSYAIPDR
ncbi:hypothetical protein BGP75_24080 [Motiliproteus sp. MSK22-1]|nr:hypothetical protein BGP75_24080 [Motiliproteus sp. MSK22-1]